jgi:hypothetical protein
MEAFTHAQRATWWEQHGEVNDRDPIEAAVACPRCQRAHCAALSTIPPRRPRVVEPPYDPNSDSQQVNRIDGEGPE